MSSKGRSARSPRRACGALGGAEYALRRGTEAQLRAIEAIRNA